MKKHIIPAHIPNPAAERNKRFIVWAYLDKHCHGAANARTKCLIRIDTGISEREVEKAIELLNKLEDRGVCSSCKPPLGYFVAETAEEINGYIEQIKSRLFSGRERLNSLYPARERLLREEEKRRVGEALGQQKIMF